MAYLIIALLLLQNFAWFIYLHKRLNDVQDEVKKGNKDQQEIKTKLTNIKKRQYDIQTAVKNTLLNALKEATIDPRAANKPARKK